METLVKKLTGQPESNHKNGYDYTVLAKTDDYEKRVYPASTWVCTSVSGVYQDTAKIEAFRILQSYVNGQNEAGAQLRMQPPILTRVCPHDGSSFELKFVVSAFLSTDQSGKEPQPTSPGVYIDHLPQMTVFVRKFEGMACEEKWAYETRKLVQCLTNKEEVRTDTYFTAMYGSPFQLVANRNEVWMLEFNKVTAMEKFEKKSEFVQMGSKRVELPSFISLPLYFALGCICFFSGILKYSMSACGLIKSNWDYLKLNTCHTPDVKQIIQLFSLQSFLSCVLSSLAAFWSFFLGLVRNL